MPRAPCAPPSSCRAGAPASTTWPTFWVYNPASNEAGEAGAFPAFRIRIRPMMSTADAAVLVLADGTVFRGRSIGARGSAVGEVVFNTAITGYQEILTDPSYCRQLVTLTYPHIGNTGVNDEDAESARVYAEGLIVRDVPRLHSSWRATQPLTDYLIRNQRPGIAEVDTRKLTRILRERGAQAGCLWAYDPQQQAGEV